MRIGVLGTGVVGRAIAGRLEGLGHEVVMGSRDPAAALGRPASGWDPQTLAEWHDGHGGVRLETFAEAAEHGELLVNATNGAASVEALRSAGAERINGKAVVDISNPLDFSAGHPGLFTGWDESLAERIQRAFPRAKVVKTLNTVTASVMVDPLSVAGGDHTIFVCGDDVDAKARVSELLRSFGWSDILDLGDLSSARGAEAYLMWWIRVRATLGDARFNVKIAR
jgi:predicted dinucleotide-binding enzyme